jgi:hypothetical protein
MLAFRVIVMVGGYSEIHTDLLGYEYEEKEERTYNENACDGWEDIYPLDED